MPGSSKVVPITLRISHEGVTSEERLCWDLQDSSNTDLDAFAKIYCQEQGLPDGVRQQVVNCIRSQLHFQEQAMREYSTAATGGLHVVRPSFFVGSQVVQDQFVCDIASLQASVSEFAELLVAEQGWPKEVLQDVVWNLYRALSRAGREAAAGALPPVDEDPAPALSTTCARGPTSQSIARLPASSAKGEGEAAAQPTQSQHTEPPQRPKVWYRVVCPPSIVRKCVEQEHFAPKAVESTPELMRQVTAELQQEDLTPYASRPASIQMAPAGMRSPTASDSRGQARKITQTSAKQAASAEEMNPIHSGAPKVRIPAATPKQPASAQKVPVAQLRGAKRGRNEKAETQQEQQQQQQMRGRFPGHTPHKPGGPSSGVGGSGQSAGGGPVGAQPGAVGQGQHTSPIHAVLQQFAAQQVGMGQLSVASNTPGSYYNVPHLNSEALEIFQGGPAGQLLGHQGGGVLAANAQLLGQQQMSQLLSQQQRMQQQAVGGGSFGGGGNAQLLMGTPGVFTHQGMLRSGSQSLGGGVNIFGGFN